jgi:hypothetical protein
LLKKKENMEVAKVLSSTPILAVGIAFLTSLIPTARGHNTGYVDPNLYIGYATNLKWLVESGGFEYHATRLPFIGLINFIITLSSQHFGLIYKFLIIFFVAFFCLKSAELLLLSRKLATSVTILICLSPIVISAASWTMPNAFAAVFSCSLILFVLKERTSIAESIVIGLLLTTSFLLNAFGSSLVIILIVVADWLRKSSISRFILTYFWIGFGILITALSYQLIWTFVLELPGSFWKPHFNVIFNRELLISNWVPISSPTSQGVTPYVILGAILVVVFLISRSQKISSLRVPTVALIAAFLFTWITYFMKINFSFNAFWYYYPYLPIMILTTLVTLKVVVIISSRFFTLQQSNLQQLGLACLLLVGISTTFGLQLKNPSLMTAYNSSSNDTSSQLLEDEIAMSEFLRALPNNRDWVATWYELDSTGYRGSLISSSSFHLLRFEGARENQTTLDFEDYFKRNQVRPLCLVMITSTSWVVTTEFDQTNAYSKRSSVILPSERAKLTSYCTETL